MPPDERIAALLADMIAFAREVMDATTTGSLERYLLDLPYRRSIERPIQLIGEAAYQLTAEFRDAHAELPWRQMIGMRHVLVHGYSRLDHARVWDVAVHDIPRLLEMLPPLLPRV
jgi:uncharacterized protein with HEPN domain